MYSELNTLLRKSVNNNTFTYQGAALPVYFSGEWENDKGAHVRVLTDTGTPESAEVGFYASVNTTGMIQLGFFLPATDKGTDYALNELASQVYTAFRRQSFVDGNFKVEWLSVERGDVMRIDGHNTVTVRVGFRVFYRGQGNYHTVKIQVIM